MTTQASAARKPKSAMRPAAKKAGSLHDLSLRQRERLFQSIREDWQDARAVVRVVRAIIREHKDAIPSVMFGTCKTLAEQEQWHRDCKRSAQLSALDDATRRILRSQCEIDDSIELFYSPGWRWRESAIRAYKLVKITYKLWMKQFSIELAQFPDTELVNEIWEAITRLAEQEKEIVH